MTKEYRSKAYAAIRYRDFGLRKEIVLATADSRINLQDKLVRNSCVFMRVVYSYTHE